ncbi:unnamed protein product [Linum trigynum]|uniref:Myb/SANT-like domain-containing protein n=1 Tax=Linum trigynum TaxID=586398 RepID=A0AAV2DYT3_9ROSI
MEKIVEKGDVDCVEIQKNDNGDDSKIWDDKAESVFIDLLVEEVKKGNRVTSTFSPTGFANLIACLKERLKRDYTKTQVKNKFNGLRGRLRAFKTLLSHTVVGYQASTGFVSAEEHVWESVIKIPAEDDKLFNEYENYEDEEGSTSGVELPLTEFNVSYAATREMTEKCDAIANQLWSDNHV